LQFWTKPLGLAVGWRRLLQNRALLARLNRYPKMKIDASKDLLKVEFSGIFVTRFRTRGMRISAEPDEDNSDDDLFLLDAEKPSGSRSLLSSVCDTLSVPTDGVTADVTGLAVACACFALRRPRSLPCAELRLRLTYHLLPF
jgi:hypothetical protein